MGTAFAISADTTCPEFGCGIERRLAVAGRCAAAIRKCRLCG